MVDKVKEQIVQSREFQQLRSAVTGLRPGGCIVLQGVAGSLLSVLAAQMFDESGKQLIVVAADEDRAEKLRDDAALLLGESVVRYFGTRPIHQAQMLDMSSSIAQIETLKSLSASATIMVVASPRSVVEKVPPPEQFSRTIIELFAAKEYPFQKLLAQLEEIGFTRKDFVESYGDFAVRGGIVDIFPYIGEHPIRLEFWGDTIESIREFDVLSQRSIRELNAASVVPSLTPEEPAQAEVPAEGLSSREHLTSSIFDYLKPDAIVVLDEPSLIEKEIDEIFKEGGEGLWTFTETENKAERFALIVHALFQVQEYEDRTSATIVNFHSERQPSFNGSIGYLIETIRKLELEGYSIVLSSDTNDEAKRLQNLIEEVVTAPSGIQGDGDDLEEAARSLIDVHPEYLHETLHSGFVFSPMRLAVFTEHEIFGRLKRRTLAKRRRFKGFSQKELQQLKRGDYVVHIDHGIGMFGGLSKIRVGGVEQEAMRLLFQEEDVLYVNLNFIGRVQKYSSQEGHVPKLNKLGTADWERTKAKAKRRIKDIARDLIAIYARRKHEKGVAFSPDSHWQRELEASFMYEDTPDQASATLAVKQDMESPSPMDRLICGDVGFGKTEVAVRAAFKAVVDGKQAAVLVPTTILALQHYNTFQDRLSRYTTRIEHITRFRSPKEQKKIAEDLSRGMIDVIIGTHRLLSKDIQFKDLGLLIIDEEHRFGVAAKEKLRNLKATVDTLALTATPIPRTLHFSLIGARDLSLINTPPRNRLPIMTEIIAADATGRHAHWHLVREAIMRELYRGGQVYFVHDRVNNIDAIADQVKAHVPEARVHVAHGQMTGHQLEKTMLQFLDKHYDVLVCTKIIESGLDIPNVNTIIINRADRFGLAELYQLRGRVGRSNVQAYAYLLTPPLSVMPKPSLRRLQAIEEFTELGSGFNLAMRDLEIRGAGNLLGAEQSGFIMEMGFEMYQRIVREAVEELREHEFKDLLVPAQHTASARGDIATLIDADIDAYIPDFYIEADTERLDIYRRLYKAVTREEIIAIRDELRDRFGDYPDEVEHLLLLVGLRLVAAEAGFTRLELRGRTLALSLPGESDTHFYGSDVTPTSPFQRLVTKLSSVQNSATFRMKQEGKVLKIVAELQKSPDIRTRLRKAEDAMKTLLHVEKVAETEP